MVKCRDASGSTCAISNQSAAFSIFSISHDVVFITRMIAPNIWENRNSSTPSCFFPAFVS